MFSEIYRQKRVLVTGHTGFKGSWLTAWLLKLGASVVGVAKDVPTQPAMFEALGLAERIRDVRADIRDLAVMRKLIVEFQPHFVFHLAAQAIVSTSYRDPIETITTNVIGTSNVLECLRPLKNPCVAIIITSDKCYDNVEWPWGYRENDRLGGKDIYSGSKGAAELIIRAYQHSFFKDDIPVCLAIGRAGNVVGGGDWAKDRIVSDCMRAWHAGRPVEIRSPRATRPWQHVLEPLSGYLALGARAASERRLHGEAFNFGPRADQNRTVIELLTDLSRHWGFIDSGQAYVIAGDVPFHEAGLLKLNCDKALLELKWKPNLQYDETVQFIADWYLAFYRPNTDLYDLTVAQIDAYEKLGKARGCAWTAPQLG
jgi:CDP-glucose 4,6-dehydratase